MAQLKELADQLGIGIAELLGDDPYVVVMDNEKALLDQFRALPADQQAAALRILAALSGPEDDS